MELLGCAALDVLSSAAANSKNQIANPTYFDFVRNCGSYDSTAGAEALLWTSRALRPNRAGFSRE